MLVEALDQEDALEKEMAAHSIILAWKIPWTEAPGGLQSMGVQSQTRLITRTHLYKNLTHMCGCHLVAKSCVQFRKLNLRLLFGRWILYHWSTWETPTHTWSETKSCLPMFFITRVQLKIEYNISNAWLSTLATGN